MLNKDEERRLEHSIYCLRNNVKLDPKTSLWLALKLKEVNRQLRRHIEGKKSNRPNEDAMIEEAKKILISRMGWDEDTAHKYIIHQAMSNKTTKFQVAKRYIESVTS